MSRLATRVTQVYLFCTYQLKKLDDKFGFRNFVKSKLISDNVDLVEIDKSEFDLIPDGAVVISLYIYAGSRLTFESIPKAKKVLNVYFAQTKGGKFLATSKGRVTNSDKYMVADLSYTRERIENPNENNIERFKRDLRNAIADAPVKTLVDTLKDEIKVLKQQRDEAYAAGYEKGLKEGRRTPLRM
tara:strand:+ start:201 stop:758 length:558 start_codon:yes stop_codon:yes gene_type:complete